MTKMKNFFAAFVLSGFLFATASCFAASEDPAWLAEKERFKNVITNENRCYETWNVLWPWAKKGNLEARAMLFVAITPFMHIGAVAVPGNNGDSITTMRDSLIMAVHSEGYKGGDSERAFMNALNEFRQSIYKGFALNSYSSGREFLECVQKKKQGCSTIAVTEGLVPSFEDYAREKDALMQQGMKGLCRLERSRRVNREKEN